MNKVNEQRELANEIAEALSNPLYGNPDIDEVSSSSVLILCTIRIHSFLAAAGGAQGRASRIGAGHTERAVDGCRSCTNSSPGRTKQSGGVYVVCFVKFCCYGLYALSYLQQDCRQQSKTTKKHSSGNYKPLWPCSVLYPPFFLMDISPYFGCHMPISLGSTVRSSIIHFIRIQFFPSLF
jgi:hypothetical protein